MLSNSISNARYRSCSEGTAEPAPGSDMDTRDAVFFACTGRAVPPPAMVLAPIRPAAATADEAAPAGPPVTAGPRFSREGLQRGIQRMQG